MDRDRLCAFFNRLQPLVGCAGKSCVTQLTAALRDLGPMPGLAGFVVVRDGVAFMVSRLDRIPDASKYQLLLRVLGTTDVSGIIGVLENWLKREPRVLDPRIRSTIAAIRSNLHKPAKCRLGRLAKPVSLSPWHFSRLFRKETGQGLPAYLRGARVASASSLMLARPDLPLNKVASKTGFRDDKELCHAFKLVTGCSPKQFLRLSQSSR